MNVGDVLFLVVCCDRHIDDVITVHATRASADQAIDAFLDTYGDEYEFEEDPDLIARARIVHGDDDRHGWIRCVRADHDDGPRARIEATTLRGEP